MSEFVMCLALLLAVPGDDPIVRVGARVALADAEEAFLAGDYASALAAYDKAALLAPGLPGLGCAAERRALCQLHDACRKLESGDYDPAALDRQIGMAMLAAPVLRPWGQALQDHLANRRKER